jgi:hypothetical protein
MKWPNLRDDSGMTSIVEAVMVMGLLSVALTIFLTSFNSFQLEATGVDNRLQNLDEARVLMQVSSKDLRTATPLSAGTSPFVLAKDAEVKFYGMVDPTVIIGSTYGPNLVRFYVNSTNPAAPVLIEEVTAPDSTSVPPAWTYTTNSPKVRLVGKYVVNPGSTPIFTYYDVNGAVLGPTPLNATQMLAVRSVGITVVVRRSASQYLPSTTLTTRVTLPNVYYQPQS